MKPTLSIAKKIAKKFLIEEMIEYFMTDMYTEKDIDNMDELEASYLSILDYRSPYIQIFAQKLNEEEILEEAQNEFNRKKQKFVEGYKALINEFKKID